MRKRKASGWIIVPGVDRKVAISNQMVLIRTVARKVWLLGLSSSPFKCSVLGILSLPHFCANSEAPSLE